MQGLNALALLVALLFLAAPAQAAFPGQNGRIAFERGDVPRENVAEIYTVNPDGSDVRRLTRNDAQDLDPVFSR